MTISFRRNFFTIIFSKLVSYVSFSPLRKYISQTINLILFSCHELKIFYSEIWTGKFDLHSFFRSETSEKIYESTFQVKTSVKFYSTQLG